MITIFRIVSVAHLDLLDLSYTAVDDAIWSILEPCLGIVNACLPVLQPALAKVFSSKAFAWTRRSTRMSTAKDTWPGSSKARVLHSNDADPKGFYPISDDDYLLKDNPVGTHNHAGASVISEPASKFELKPGRDTAVPHGDIKITRSWDVQSSSGRSV